ncbi:MAG: hypothetical protein ABWZ99_16520, partial [Ilumatobacteraceae bacterium]
MNGGAASATPFAVWAPRPLKVELQIEDRTVPMTERGGWWAPDPDELASLTDLPIGTRYGYLVDGNERALPDPR